MTIWRVWVPRRARLLRWAFRGGCILWVLLLMGELTASYPNPTRVLGILLIGGGALYFFRVGVGTLEREWSRRGRRVGRQLVREGSGLPLEESLEDVVTFLIGRDARHLGLFPWPGRFGALVGQVLQQILSLSDAKAGCHRAMSRCLCLLEMGRAHWGLGRFAKIPAARTTFEGLHDEEFLQLLLTVLTLLSALFRFHVTRWEMPSGPFARGPLARLRGSWFPFCALEPSPRIFPPPLPEEAEEMLASCGPSDGWMLGTLSSWIFKGDGESLARLVHALSGERPWLGKGVP